MLLSPLAPRGDERGHFVEILRQGDYPERFVQSNHSRSKKGALRGLHYHRLQADLWYVVSGRAQVALADLRARTVAPTTMTIELDEERPATLYIPAGVAHGYLALTDMDLVYWVTREYDATDEHGVAWNDPNLSIQWAVDDPVLSKRDAENPLLQWDLIPSFS